MLDVESKQIWFSDALAPEVAVYFRAHEYAHHWLHGPGFSCSTDEVMQGAAGDLAMGVSRVQGYSPGERQEHEANVFARELLLPRPLLRRWFIDERLSAGEIAERVGIAIELVFHQLADTVLIGDLVEQSDVSEAESCQTQPPLDESQSVVASWDRGPLFVEAGPGTGKTRTLVGRIERLLDAGTPPDSILALTFSNKAAAEMRERVADSRPDDAPRVWLGTIHAFGLELLRRYGDRLGLPPDPRVLDPIDGLSLLEDLLPALQLDHYHNIYEPRLNLRDLLQGISRAKDELADIERYRTYAEAMQARAASPEQQVAAAKALEVARVYRLYQDRLSQEGTLDFGDLVMLAVQLLREHVDVRDTVRGDYPHVLVDEYQDINHASAELLALLAGEGERFWVVGDMRQAIYRFRGAAPRNVRSFVTRFPGAQRLPLRVNYRSGREIVQTVAGLARRMRVSEGLDFTPWEVHRSGSAGEVALEIAADAEAEGVGIARDVARRRALGVRYRDQAVLCRSHTILSRVAAQLEAAGVPTLYLGNLFEREEIRDLLALLELTCAGRGRGLLRVGSLPEYRIPRADILAMLDVARESEQPFPRVLSRAATNQGLSEDGRRGFDLLARHLDGITYGSNAWRFLVEFLFNRSNHAHSLLQDGSPSGRQRRLAVYQLLSFAHRNRRFRKKREFLDHIRRLEAYGEERELRSVPEWANGIDAVRLLTVHASKGLQFEVVYLPKLAKGHFPTRRRGNACPLPEGLVPADADGADPHEEEEECLFFVGLSRAREALVLSRAKRYGACRSNPSPLLDVIADGLPRAPDGEPSWTSAPGASPAGTAEHPRQPPRAGDRTFDVRDLDVYLACPRQYYYEQVLELPRGRSDSAYVTFHRVVYQVLGWMSDELAEGRAFGPEQAVQRLDDTWAEAGPVGHPHAALYLAHARKMVRLAAERATLSGGLMRAIEWSVDLEHGTVLVTPDLVEGGDPATVTRIRTGSPTQSEAKKPIYGLYHEGARQAFGGGHRLQALYLSTGDVEPIELTPKKVKTRLAKYDEAMRGILKGEFEPTPNERRCPRCPHYFVCAAGQ